MPSLNCHLSHSSQLTKIDLNPLSLVVCLGRPSSCLTPANWNIKPCIARSVVCSPLKTQIMLLGTNKLKLKTRQKAAMRYKLWSVPVYLPQRRRSCQNLVCIYSECQGASHSLKETVIQFNRKSLIVLMINIREDLALLFSILLAYINIFKEREKCMSELLKLQDILQFSQDTYKRPVTLGTRSDLENGT